MKDKLQQVRDALVQSATEISAETIKNNKKAIATLDRLIAEHEGEGWQSIETAPKDGTQIIVYRPVYDGRYIPQVGYDYFRKWQAKPNGCWMNSRDDCQPTHWMPLPQPPTMQKEPNHDK